ncbi:MAG: hypothetical protein LAO09_11415, partial [Acidobacteriia bacterium]|nr:hypothetical protein [Terriglobia bacterium]
MSELHGFARRGNRSPTYTCWLAAKGRCFNVDHADYKDYGSRGITMCNRWKHSFENFLADLGER